MRDLLTRQADDDEAPKPRKRRQGDATGKAFEVPRVPQDDTATKEIMLPANDVPPSGEGLTGFASLNIWHANTQASGNDFHKEFNPSANGSRLVLVPVVGCPGSKPCLEYLADRKARSYLWPVCEARAMTSIYQWRRIAPSKQELLFALRMLSPSMA